MANRYWVGGTGTWNTSSTTNWSASSGGAAGASVPTVADSVFFDQALTYTVTMTGALACLDMNVTAGTVSFITGTTPTLTVAGNWSTIAGTVWSQTGTVTFTATTAKTVNTNSVTISSPFTFNGTGGSWTLQNNLTLTSTLTTTLTAGTLALDTYTLSTGLFASASAVARTINFGTGKIVTTSATTSTVWNTSTITNLTISGTSLVECRGGGTAVTKTISAGALSEANAINFSLLETTGTTTYAFTASNTVKNLIVNGSQTISNIAITIYGIFTHLTTNGTTTFTGGTNAWTYAATSGSQNITTISDAGINNVGSVIFNGGASGDLLSFPASSTAYNLSGASWTVECWIYPTITTFIDVQSRFLMGGTNNVNTAWVLALNADYSINFAVPSSGTVGINTAANAIQRNKWQHVAVVSNAGTSTIYIDGVQAVTPITTLTKPVSASIGFKIGYDNVTTVLTQFSGFISEVRINTTTAVYTGAFTPPTLAALATSGSSSAAAYSSTTNVNTSFAASTTTLLTCQSTSLFVDNSNGALAVTRTGSPVVSIASASVYSYNFPWIFGSASSTATWTLVNNTTLSRQVTLVTGTLNFNNKTLSSLGFTINNTVGTPSITNTGGPGSLSLTMPITHTTGTLTLPFNLTTTNILGYTFTAGTLSLSSYTLTTPVFSSANANARTIAFGTGKIIISSTITSTVWTTATVTNLSITGTSLVEFQGGGTGVTKTINTGTLSEAQSINFSLIETTGTATYAFTASNVVKNLIVDGVQTISNIAITIYGAFTHTTTNGTTTFTAGANAWTFAATSGSYSIGNIVGFTYDFPWTFGSAASTATWTLANNLVFGTIRTLTLVTGTFDFNNKTFTGSLNGIAINNTVGTFTLANTGSSSFTTTVPLKLLAGTFTLPFNVTASNASGFEFSGGTLNLNTFILTAFKCSSFTATAKTINFGTSKIILNGSTGASLAIWDWITSSGLTISGTPLVECIGGGTVIVKTIFPGTTTESNAISFSLLETTGTVSYSLGGSYKNLIFNGTQTIQSGINAVTLYGTFTHLTSNGTSTFGSGTAAFTFAATSGNYDITTVSGVTYDFPWTFGSSASTATWTIANNLTIGATRALTFNTGTLDWNNKTLTGASGITQVTGSFTLNNTGGTTFNANALAITHTSGNLTLGTNLTTTAATGYTLTAGTLSLGTSTLTTPVFLSNNANVRGINYGTGQLALTGNAATIFDITTATSFTTSGTVYINSTYTGSTGTRTIVTGFTLAQSVGYDVATSGTTGIVLSPSATDIVALTGGFEDIDLTGFTGTLSNTARTIYGNLTIPSSGGTFTAGTLVTTFAATTSKTITTNGRTLDFPIIFNGVGGSWALQDALTSSATRTTTLTAGTLNLNNFVHTTGFFSSSGATARTLAFGSTGQLVLAGSNATIFDVTTATNFTTTGTVYINCTYASSVGTRTITTGFTEAQAVGYDIVTSGTAGIILSPSATDIVVLSGSFEDINLTGFIGTLSNTARTIYGNWINPASGGTYTAGTNETIFISSSSKTITSNGRTLDFPIRFATSGALSFNGSTQYLSVSSTAFDFTSSSSCTIECWIYVTSNTTNGHIYQNYTTGGTSGTGQIFGWSSSTVYFAEYNGSFAGAPQFNISSPATLSINTWYHVAVVKSGTGSNNIKMYVNGQLSVTGTLANFAAPGSATTYIGARNFNGIKDYFPGYISNFRVVKDVAVYTDTFTSPTAPLSITQSSGTNISAITSNQTSLLLADAAAPVALTYQTDSSNYGFIVGGTGTSFVYASPFTSTTWTLQTALTVGSTRTTTLSSGILNLNNYTLTTGLFNSSAIGARTLAFGSTGQLTIVGSGATIFDVSTATNYNTTGTVYINCTYASSVGTRTITTGFTEAQSAGYSIATSGTSGIVLSPSATDIVALTGSFFSVNLTGFTGTLSNIARTIYGSWTNPASGGTYTAGTNATTFASTSSKTITSNGRTLDFPITFNGVGGSWALQTAFTTGSTRTTTLTAGTLNLNNFTFTTQIFSSSGAVARTLAFGSSGQLALVGSGTTIFDITTATNYSTTGTVYVNSTYASSVGTRTIVTGFTEVQADAGYSVATSGTTGIVLSPSATDIVALTGSYNDINLTGFIGTLSNVARTVYGNWTNPLTGGTYTAGAVATTFGSTSSQTITTNGRTLDFALTFDGVGGTWTLQDNLTIGATRILTWNNGTLDLNNFALSNPASITINGGATGLFTVKNTGGTQLVTKAVAVTHTTGELNLFLDMTFAAYTFTAGTITLNSYTLTCTTWTSTSTTARTFAFGTGNITVTASGACFNMLAATNHVVTGTPNVNITNSTTTATSVVPGVVTEAQSLNFIFSGGSYALTFLATASHAARSITFSEGWAGTWAATSTGVIYGSFSLSTTMTLTISASAMTFGGTSGTKTITTASKTIPFPLTFNGVGGTFQLIGALTTSAAVTLTNGTFDGNSQTISGVTAFTMVTGTATIQNVSTALAFTLTSGTLNVGSACSFGAFTLTSGTLNLGSACSFGAYTFTAGTLNLSSYTLTCTTWTSTSTTARTLAFGTGNITVTASGACFNMLAATNITVTGTPNVNITNATTTATSVVSGVLTEAQSMNFIFSGGAYTLTFLGTASHTARDINFTSFSGTLAAIAACTVYGNVILGASMTFTSSASALTLGATSAKTITTNYNAFSPVSIPFPITFNGVGGSWSLQDTLQVASTVTLTAGTLNLNDKRLSPYIFNASGSTTRGIIFSGGSDILCIGPSGTLFTTATATNLTITGTPNVAIFPQGVVGAVTVASSGTEAQSFNFSFYSDSVYTLTFLGTASYIARDVDFSNFSGTWAATSTGTIYGNVTLNGSMTLTTSASAMTLGGTSGTKTFKSNGKAITFPINLNASGATKQLTDAFTMATITHTFTHTNGTLDLNGYTATVGLYTTATGTKNLTLTNGTLVIAGSGSTAFNNAVPTGFTTTDASGTGKISLTSSTAKTFVGGGSTYNCAVSHDGAGVLTFTGSSSFRSLTTGVAAASFIFTIATTQTVTSWNVNGTAGNLVVINSSTSGTLANISKTGGGSMDYVSIRDIAFQPCSTNGSGALPILWAADNSTNRGNNFGIVFEAYNANARTYVISLTSVTSWTIPADWNSSDNTIHLIGGGGGAAGSRTVGGLGGGTGGGGGGYTKILNYSSAVGTVISTTIGTAGSGGAANFSGVVGGTTVFATDTGTTTYKASFNGSTQYLVVPQSSAMVMSADFCIEGWIYTTNLGTVILDQYASGTPTGSYQIQTTGAGVLQFIYNTGVTLNFVTLSINRWYHFAVTRSGSTIRLFLNGILVNSTTYSGAIGVSNYDLWIGQQQAGGVFYFNGHMSNIRIVKGSPVYTANFCPTVTPLTAITNTLLLTCNDSTLIDGGTGNSGVPFTISNPNSVTTSTFALPYYAGAGGAGGYGTGGAAGVGLTYNGGRGGLGSSYGGSGGGGGGGGGAGGPNGAGGQGGDNFVNNGGATGGGGNGGGYPGTTTAGGNGWLNTGGGTNAGGAASAGTLGTGGGAGPVPTFQVGQPGGSGFDIYGLVGGGGGGGGNNGGSGGGVGGSGGNYGAGGGGAGVNAGANPATYAGGAGAQGLIVIRYYVSATATGNTMFFAFF